MQTKLGLLVLAVISASFPAGLLAQTAESPVPLESRVRVTTRSAPGLESVGALDSWDGTSLELSGSDFELRTIPLSDLATLEISRGKKGHWVLGTLVGTGIGIAAGLIIAQNSTADVDPDNWFSGMAEPAEDAGIVFLSTLSGMVLGAAVGAMIKTEKWEDVPLPDGEPLSLATVARY
jgi:hypothetical protein